MKEILRTLFMMLSEQSKVKEIRSIYALKLYVEF